MSKTPAPLRIGIFGADKAADHKGRAANLWAPGYAAAVTAAGGVPVMLTPPKPGVTWAKVLRDLDGVVFLGGDPASPTRAADEKRFCEWCRDRELPLLAVDQ